MANEEKNRTGDVFTDAAVDLEEDWPWYAEAFRRMRAGLESISADPGEMGGRARAALASAKRAAEGEAWTGSPVWTG